MGGLGVHPQEKKNQNFKFECLKWPILAEMTAKSGIYFNFLCQQGGGYSPLWCLEGGPDPPPPGGNPDQFKSLFGTKRAFKHQDFSNVLSEIKQIWVIFTHLKSDAVGRGSETQIQVGGGFQLFNLAL